MDRYDEFLKELLRVAPRDFLHFLFPEENTECWKIQIHKKELSYVSRRADHFVRILTERGEEFFLHVEFQFEPNRKLPFRLHTYRVLLEEEEELPVYWV